MLVPEKKEASIGSSKLILTFAQTTTGRNVLLILLFSLRKKFQKSFHRQQMGTWTCNIVAVVYRDNINYLLFDIFMLHWCCFFSSLDCFTFFFVSYQNAYWNVVQRGWNIIRCPSSSTLGLRNFVKTGEGEKQHEIKRKDRRWHSFTQRASFRVCFTCSKQGPSIVCLSTLHRTIVNCQRRRFPAQKYVHNMKLSLSRRAEQESFPFIDKLTMKFREICSQMALSNPPALRRKTDYSYFVPFSLRAFSLRSMEN